MLSNIKCNFYIIILSLYQNKCKFLSSFLFRPCRTNFIFFLSPRQTFIISRNKLTLPTCHIIPQLEFRKLNCHFKIKRAEKTIVCEIKKWDVYVRSNFLSESYKKTHIKTYCFFLESKLKHKRQFIVN